MTPPDARAALDALNRVLNYCCFDDQDFENTKEDRELIRAALTQMIDGGWNSDMDAAPRDWSDLLLFVPQSEENNDVMQGYYSCWDGGKDCWMSFRNEKISPTHWQPLPTLPQENSHE